MGVTVTSWPTHQYTLTISQSSALGLIERRRAYSSIALSHGMALFLAFFFYVGCFLSFSFFFFKQKTAYEITRRLEFRRVLFRSIPDPRISALAVRILEAAKAEVPGDEI